MALLLLSPRPPSLCCPTTAVGMPLPCPRPTPSPSAAGPKLDSVFLVFEYCPHDMGRLVDAMRQPFHESEVKCLMQQVCGGGQCALGVAGGGRGSEVQRLMQSRCRVHWGWQGRRGNEGVTG